jgi:hypothetical protein
MAQDRNKIFGCQIKLQGGAMKELLMLTGALLLLTGCMQERPPFNEAEDRKMILENIDTNLRGLVNNNVEEASVDLKSGAAFLVGSGKIKNLTAAEYKKGFEDQFQKGNYTEATKLSEPFIVFSKDGSMAWYIGTFQFQYTHKDSLGKTKTVKLKDAILCVLEKKDNHWTLVAQAETFSDEK